MFVPITPINPTHRSYPKSWLNMGVYWRGYVDTIRAEAPLVYRNQSLFDVLRQNLIDYITNARTYCMKATRHQPIKPYAHFDSRTEMQLRRLVKR